MARLGAGVRKRKDGTLEKRFTVKGKRFSVYGKTSKELQQKEQEARKLIESGTYRENRNITLDEYFKEWVAGKRAGIKGNTLKTYKSYYYKHISSVLGSRRIQQIERREILMLQKRASDDLSVSTSNMVVNTLRIILHDAIRDGIITKNPADGVRNIKEDGDKATDTFHRALTEEEQRVFMQEMTLDYYYEFVALLLCSGMRCGEAAALTWNDIDYKENVIHITKTTTYTEDNELTIGTPKSKAGKRDIPLTETLKGVLKSQRQKYGNVFPIQNNKVFSSIYGDYVRNYAVNRAIDDAIKRLADKDIIIEHFTAHALRDTFATRFIEQGGTPQTLKTILGHTSLAMTMDLYSHVLPNTKQKEMDALKISI